MSDEQVPGPRLYYGVTVSSTFTDLKDHRAALIRSINEYGLKDVAMEHDYAKNMDVIKSSLQMVRDGAAYICVIGKRYGEIPKSPERNPNNLSITELEFNEALRLGRAILLFLMGENHLVREVDVETNVRKKQLKAFRERAKRMNADSPVQRVYATFNSLEEFKEQIGPSIANLRSVLEEKPQAIKVQAASVADGSVSLVGPKPNHDTSAANPFIWRGAIYDPAAFFGRENELRRLRDFLRNRQHVQVVAPRRMGKSSLLLKICQSLRQWLTSASVAYVDMSDAGVRTKVGWLRRVSQDWGWVPKAKDDADFSDNVRKAARGGTLLVLCLDEFENFTELRSEFDLEFFRNLRACAQLPAGKGGLSIITASRVELSALNERDPILSAFHNIMPPLHLSLFTEAEAAAFVNLPRMGALTFTSEEASAILNFAQGHPLKLQIASWHIVEARITNTFLAQAMQSAQREGEELLAGAT